MTLGYSKGVKIDNRQVSGNLQSAHRMCSCWPVRDDALPHDGLVQVSHGQISIEEIRPSVAETKGFRNIKKT